MGSVEPDWDEVLDKTKDGRFGHRGTIERHSSNSSKRHWQGSMRRIGSSSKTARIGTLLSIVPELGPALQLVFSVLWDFAFAFRKAEAQRAALNAMYQHVEKMINQALAENVADQARAYNQSISASAQDYYLAVKEYKDGQSSAQVVDIIIARFEGCKQQLTNMLALFSQPSYAKNTVLSYGSSLTLYVTMLREMIFNGSKFGYTAALLKDFQDDINAQLTAAFSKHMYAAISKMFKDVIDDGAFYYYASSDIPVSLSKLAGGMMNFQMEWHGGVPCVIAKDNDWGMADLVDTKAQYQLKLREDIGAKRYYKVPQVFMAGHACLHVYTDVGKDLVVAKFNVDGVQNVKLRAYYMEDPDDYDSNDIKVTVSTYNSQELEFNLNAPSQRIASFPWVRSYYQDEVWSTDESKYKDNMVVHYNEYSNSFKPADDIDRTYTIKTRGITNYYIIGFEVLGS